MRNRTIDLALVQVPRGSLPEVLRKNETTTMKGRAFIRRRLIVVAVKAMAEQLRATAVTLNLYPGMMTPA
jgi:hypothetical protein